MVKMVENEKCCHIIAEDVENAVILEGSPELGLIGNIVGWLLVEELKMKEIGYIESKYFPPLAVLYKGVAIHPFRIYSADDLVLFLSDFVVPPNVTYDMTNVIVEWMERNHSKEIITLNSIAVREKTNGVAGAANTEEGLKRLGDLEIPVLPFGNINGISGTLLTRAHTSNIPGSCLFAEVLNQYPDPRAAASVVDVLNRMLDIKVDADPLLKEAEEIESRLKELAQAVQSEQESPAYM
ncbi:MAG TPA: proteasome assembly chaperone family protein [Methanobacteriaceae archaeon]|nr:proteasome assembly chaperone family protein [Methanobacteriaceae archaeon]